MHHEISDKVLEWKKISTKHVIQDPWIDFRNSKYQFPDGRTIEPFYTFSKRDYVVIVARNTEGRFLCVRQFRHGINCLTTEFPAGGLEYLFPDNDHRLREREEMVPAETAEAAAIRELSEETGYASNEWKHIISVPSNATDTDNYAHVFLAENCVRTGIQRLDDTEFLNVKLLCAEEIDEMIRQGQFQQAIHIMSWYMFKDYVKKLSEI